MCLMYVCSYIWMFTGMDDSVSPGYHQSNAATTNGNLSEDITIDNLSSHVPNIAKLMRTKVCGASYICFMCHLQVVHH